METQNEKIAGWVGVNVVNCPDCKTKMIEVVGSFGKRAYNMRLVSCKTCNKIYEQRVS